MAKLVFVISYLNNQMIFRISKNLTGCRSFNLFIFNETGRNHNHMAITIGSNICVWINANTLCYHFCQDIHHLSSILLSSRQGDVLMSIPKKYCPSTKVKSDFRLFSGKLPRFQAKTCAFLGFSQI